MLDDPDTADGRLYESIPDACTYLDDIAASFRQDFEEEINDIKNRSENLDILGGSAETQYAGVIEFLRIPGNENRARDVIRDTLEAMRTIERERRDATYCSREIRQAYTKLQNALGALDENADTTGIIDILNNIDQTAADIREWLKNVNNQD